MDFRDVAYDLYFFCKLSQCIQSVFSPSEDYIAVKILPTLPARKEHESNLDLESEGQALNWLKRGINR